MEILNSTIVIASLLGIAISVILILLVVLAREEINEIFRDKILKIKEEIKSGKNAEIEGGSKDLEAQLNGLLSSATKSVIKAEKLAKVTSSSVPFPIKIMRNAIDVINNPYNETNVVKMFFMICVFSGFGLISSTLLTNPAMGIATCVMGVIMPFTLVSMNGIRKKLKIMKGNAHLLSVHLPNYLDSSTLEESFRRSLKSLSSGSLQYTTVSKCLSNMITLNMTTKEALTVLKRELKADKYVSDYFDIVERAETLDSKYKFILASIIKNFEELVINNDMVVTFSYWLYVMYIMAVVAMIVVVGILKNTDTETYKFLSGTLQGQAVILVVFVTAIVIGIILSGAADLINLDITKKKEKDPLEEDIYV